MVSEFFQAYLALYFMYILCYDLKNAESYLEDNDEKVWGILFAY